MSHQQDAMCTTLNHLMHCLNRIEALNNQKTGHFILGEGLGSKTKVMEIHDKFFHGMHTYKLIRTKDRKTQEIKFQDNIYKAIDELLTPPI